MKQIENLLKLELGHFDTRKGLNRSEKIIPENIVEALEAGEFTSEMLDTLSKDFPIFRYKSCVTIHGKWEGVTIERIGNYKNILQNGNGSLEVRYSALDNQKRQEITTNLRLADSDFYYYQNSQGSLYSKEQRVTAENFEAVKADMFAAAERVKNVTNAYGSCQVTRTNNFGNIYLRLEISLLAIRAEAILPFTLALLNISQDEFEAKTSAARAQEIADRLVREREEEARQEQRAKNTEIMNGKMNVLKEQIANYPECLDPKKGTLVKVAFDRYDPEPFFVLLRFEKASGFGRIVVAKARTKALNTPTNSLEWKIEKALKPAEIKGAYRLMK